MSAVDEVYQYGQDTFNVPERGKIRIEGCPSSITDQLRRASFTRESPGVYTKSQAALDDDQEYQVVTVTVDGDEDEVLHVEATDIIGVVSLTPSSKVQVDPKIEWEYIFDMLLAVYDQNRSIEYHGIPLQDFLSDDIHLDDVFVVLAINYLDGLEAIQRNGYIRDLDIRRFDSLDGRGEIDVEQTLLNHAQGNLEPHWIRNETEYNNAVNSLLHYAGKTLIRLFRQNAAEHDHPAYDRIFSEVHREVERLESMGIGSGLDRMDEYRELSLYDLPKQRQYYRKTFDVAKAILSSSLGQQLRDGPRELVVDYVLNMESLFEQYSQVVIERALSKVKSYDYLDKLDDVTPVRSPSVNPFEGEKKISHQPDHALQEGDETLAVLDSKYYAEGHDPVKDSSSRSRLFSYAYLLHSDRLAFLCPLLEPKTRQVAQTGAELQILSPDEFSLDAYDGVIHEYLHEVLAEDAPELEAFRAVAENKLCLDGVTTAELSEATSMSGPFTFKDAKAFSLRVIKSAANEHSWNVRNRHDLQLEGEWTRDQIQDRCDQRYEHTTTCVPVFRNEDGNDLIDLYFLQNGGKAVEKEGPFKLLTDDNEEKKPEGGSRKTSSGGTIQPRENHVVDKITRSDIAGDDTATIAVFPTRPSGLPFLKEKNAWGFVRANRDFEYVAMYVSRGPKEIKYVAKVRDMVQPEEAKLQRPPLDYVDRPEIADGKMVVRFEPGSLYELADPVPFGERAPQSLEYTTLGRLKQANSTDEML